MLNFSSLLSVFYPLNCKCCNRALVKGEEFFCIHCELNFGEILPTRDFHSELEQLFWGKTKIEKAISSFQFYKQENLQHLIHEFKYNGNFKIAVKMGELMAMKLNKNEVVFDVISFVPMHKKKQNKRGFNQAEKLALGVSKALNIPCCSLLKRLEETGTQTQKGVFDRFENMKEKFGATEEVIAFKHVLLVDDVVTTGATLAACANVLTELGLKVSVLCLAFRSLND